MRIDFRCVVLQCLALAEASNNQISLERTHALEAEKRCHDSERALAEEKESNGAQVTALKEQIEQLSLALSQRSDELKAVEEKLLAFRAKQTATVLAATLPEL